MKNNDAALFIRKISLLALILSVFFGTSVALLTVSGELLPIDEIIRRQRGDGTTLYGCAYSAAELYYKTKSVAERNFDVVAIGTSRVQQIRSESFIPGIRFFNAGAAQFDTMHFSSFLKRIPQGKEPAVILLALDQFAFNPQWERLESARDPEKDFENTISRKDIILLGCIGVYKDFVRKRFSPLRILNARNKIGLYAIIDNTGYRADGSSAVDSHGIKSTRFNDAFRNIDRSRAVFKYGSGISSAAVSELEVFLEGCKSRNIRVVAFLAPYPRAVYERMMERRDKYAFVFELAGVLRPVFDRYSFGLYDLSDLAEVGASDNETIDGYHGSEKAYAKLMVRLAELDRQVRPMIDSVRLRKALAESDNDFTVFDREKAP